MQKNSSVSKGKAKSAPLLPVVNKAEEAISIDFNSLFSPIEAQVVSPIDEYYGHARELLVSAAKPEVEADDMLMRLLVLELVSSAELYFRRVLSGIIQICPIVENVAAKRPLLLGAIGYYPKQSIGYALLDGVSLSGEGDVKRQTLNITGIEIKPNSSLASTLSAFEKVCQLRHVIVHSKGEAGAKNIIELQLEIKTHSKLKISALAFQKLVVITHNAVRAYNTFLFQSILPDWQKRGVLEGSWNSDWRRFKPLYGLFFSASDSKNMGDAKAAYTAYQTSLATS